MKLHITVDNATYEVDVEVADDIRPQPLPLAFDTAKMSVPVAPPAGAPTAPSSSAPDGKSCRSPVNGTVARIVAQVGQAIQPGDVLVVLEAMKMETNIAAPVAGTVSRILVDAGQAVRSQQVLLEFA